MLLNSPNFDENLFEDKCEEQTPRFIYTSHEIDKLADYLNWFTETYPVTKSIIELLRATQKFKAAATCDEYFVTQRDQNKTDADLHQLLDEMAANLEAEQLLLKREDSANHHYKFLDTAIKYCMQSIVKSISELSANDRIARFYDGSHLEALIKDAFALTNNKRK